MFPHPSSLIPRTSPGFTLIELLVVIAIIGILASIVLASLGSARAKGRDAKRLSDIKQLQVALELFTQDHSGKYPAKPADLVPTYIASEPTDPKDGTTKYNYAAIGLGVGPACSATTYHLGAVLENANPVLNGDADQPSTYGGTGNPCSGGARFQGVSTDCGATAGATDLCYDVTP